MKATHICSFPDPCNYKIRVNGKEYTFDFSERFGPAVIGKRGNILATQPSGRNPFWRAVSWWVRQGKHIDADGYCLWEQPTEKVYRVSGRNYVSEHLYLKLRSEGKLPEIEPTIIEVNL